MKILYVTDYIKCAQKSGGFINDYLNDILFYGLHELENVEVVDSTKIIHLYKENLDQIDNRLLWGKGFTTSYLIENDNTDRNNIEDKIKDRYFDLIIYGSVNRCMQYYDIVSKFYRANEVFLIDGDDSTNIHSLSKKHPYFKRELTTNEFIPIHFAIPTCKIANKKLDKIQEYAKIIPGEVGYIFENEQYYYDDYNKSYYGVTMKKAGWDCMRHYEILANNCIPYFIDLEDCPKYTLTNLPKDLLIEARELTKNFDNQKYFSILGELYEYTKENLTTKKLAQHILNYV
jgi:hypothetical protein